MTGHKLTVHIYVEGDMVAASEVAEEIRRQVTWPDTVGFVGMDISEVDEEPKEQMGT